MSRAKPNGREFFDRRKKVQKSELSQHICDRNEKLLNQVVVVEAVHLSCRKVRSLCPTVLGRFSLRCLVLLNKVSLSPTQHSTVSDNPSHLLAVPPSHQGVSRPTLRVGDLQAVGAKNPSFEIASTAAGCPLCGCARGLTGRRPPPPPPPIYPPAPPGSGPAQLSFSSLGKQGVLAGYCTGLFFCAATQTSANCHSPYTHTARFVREERGHGCQTAIRAACATCIAT